MDNDKYHGLTKAAYYHRLRTWTTTLYDADGNEHHVSPKHHMKKKQQPQDNK